MSDRLTELQRQRALVQVHLAWLDREIAGEQGIRPSPVAPLANSPTPLLAPSPATANAQDSAAILPQFGSDSKSEVQSVRKGCFIVFAISMVPALGVLGYVLYQFYLSYISRH